MDMVQYLEARLEAAERSALFAQQELGQAVEENTLLRQALAEQGEELYEVKQSESSLQARVLKLIEEACASERKVAGYERDQDLITRLIEEKRRLKRQIDELLSQIAEMQLEAEQQHSIREGLNDRISTLLREQRAVNEQYPKEVKRAWWSAVKWVLKDVYQFSDEGYYRLIRALYEPTLE